jgi:hypothetical protein
VNVPRWDSHANQVQVTLEVDGEELEGAGGLPFVFEQVVLRATPSSGLVFGSYLVVHGFGFREERRGYVCQLRAMISENRLEVNGTVVQPAVPRSTSLECRLPLWPHAEAAVDVLLFSEGEEVAVLGERPKFQLYAGWLTAEIAANYTFQGGGEVIVIGGGFSVSDRRYSCGWSAEAAAIGDSCRQFDMMPCPEVSSSDSTIPTSLQGPYAAEDWGRLRCYLPAWLNPNQQLLLRVYSRGQQVTKLAVDPTLAVTKIVGAPGIHVPSASTNGNWRGGAVLTLSGSSFGLVDLSQRARIGQTACTSTSWSTDTALLCRLPRGANSLTVGAAVTVGTHHLSQVSAYFTYDGPLVHGVAPLQQTDGRSFGISARGNSAPHAPAMVQISGRYFRASLQARLGGSACESSSWESDTTARCLVSLQGAVGNDHTVVVTVSSSQGTGAGILSYDRPVMARSPVGVYNTPSSPVAPMLNFQAANLGRSDYSAALRVSSSAAAATVWIADTVVQGRVAVGVGGTLRVVVTAGGRAAMAGTSTEVASYDLPSILPSFNLPTHAAIWAADSGRKLAVKGQGWGTYAVSAQVRLGVTAAETTIWVSDTSIQLQGSSGVGGTQRITVTAGVQSGTGLAAASYDAPSMVWAHREMDEGLRFEHSGFSSNGVGLVMERQHWTVVDDPRSERVFPSDWVSCGDAAGLCTQLVVRLGGSGLPAGVAASSVMLQRAASFPEDKVPRSQLLRSVEGTSFVYSPPAWSEQGILPHYSVGATAWPDFFFVASLVSFDDDWVGLAVFYHDKDNYMRFEMNRVARRLKRRVAGVLEVLWDEPNSDGFEPGEIYTVRIRANSGRVTVFVDPGSDINADEALWTRVCGVASNDGTALVCEATLSGEQEPGTVALFESGGNSAHFFNIRLYRHPFLARHANGPAPGGQALTVRGSSLGIWGSSQGARQESTSCESSAWISDTSLLSRTPSGVARGTMRVAVTLGIRTGTITEIVSYDVPRVNILIGGTANQARLGGKPLQVGDGSEGPFPLQATGTNLGAVDYSGSMRFGNTACETTVWRSDTQLAGKVAPGNSGSMRVVLTAGERMGSLSEAVSYDVPTLIATEVKDRSGNVAWDVSSFVAMNGLFETAVYTSRARLGGSACESTEWASESQVMCRSASGSRGSLSFAVTAGTHVGTLTEALSFDVGWVQRAVSPGNVADGVSITRTMSLALNSHAGNGAWSFTSAARVGATACEATVWIVADEVVCRTARGIGSSNRVLVTIGQLVSSLSESLSYDAGVVNSTRVDEGQLSKSGGEELLLLGFSFTDDASAAVRVGGTACESTAWQSVSAVCCFSAAGVGGSLRVILTLGSRPGSVTEAASYDSVGELIGADLSVPPPVESWPTLARISDPDPLLVLEEARLGAYSLAARVGSTACEASVWPSVTQLACLVPSGVGAFKFRVTVTAGERVATGPPGAFNYSAPLLQAAPVSNVPTVGRNTLIAGGNFGAYDSSFSAWVGQTACLNVSWVSDSEVLCMVSQGVRAGQDVVMEVAQSVGTLVAGFSFDLPAPSDLVSIGTYMSDWKLRTWGGDYRGGWELTVIGSGFGVVDYGPEVRIAGRACNATRWVSDSEVVCEGVPPAPIWGVSGFEFLLCNTSSCRMNVSVAVEVGSQNSTEGTELWYSCPCDAGSLICLEAELNSTALKDASILDAFLPECRDVDECVGGCFPGHYPSPDLHFEKIFVSDVFNCGK